MKSAVIDLGTNTFHLLIGEKAAPFNIITNKRVPVKLGEGSNGMVEIKQEPFERGLKAIAEFTKTISSNKLENITAVATSCIRTAKNGREFIDQAMQCAGFEISIIDGDREAELIYHGVRVAVEINEPVLIMDIGGGSIEFIIADSKNIFWKRSYQLGIARLLDQFAPEDPITAENTTSIIQHLDTELQGLIEQLKTYNIGTLIGASGSFESFAEMIACQIYHDPRLILNKKNFDFNPRDINFIHRKLINSSFEERLAMRGLVPMRADMMVVSSICIQWILNKWDFEKVKLSGYAMKEGLLWESFNKT